MLAESNSTIADTVELVKHQKIFDRLKESPFFQSYCSIFQQTTGLPLELHSLSDEHVQVCSGSINQNRFCQLLNQGTEGCEQCHLSQKCLSQGDAKSRVQSITCFAGLRETAIPLMLGGVVIALLKTGQVLHEPITSVNWDQVSSQLGVEGEELAELAQAYLETPVIGAEKYRAMVTLLAAFSLQLNKLASRIAFDLEQEQVDLVERAKALIEEHLTESLTFNDVAEYLKISPFYFCRRFKKETGMTMTQYLSMHRVEVAKELLRSSKLRVTDVAYEVGFQSLSQFNRSFRKLTGVSPSQFRKAREFA
ncbi:MAG: AraC family transcriptional regulator [Roseibacillus sp.]